MTDALSPAAVTSVGEAAAAAVGWRVAGQVQVTVIAKATFAFANGNEARRVRAREVRHADVHHGNSPLRSVRWASDLAPHLGRVDVLFTGSAFAPPGSPVRALTVRLSLFEGDRPGDDGPAPTLAPGESAGPRSSRPLAPTGPLLDKALLVRDEAGFQEMPIVYERAFGGMHHPDNPVGVGATPGSSAPNIVDPARPQRAAGFGPIARSWLARRSLLGSTPRSRLEGPVIDIPDGFDWSYFQAAPADQWLPSLRGDEWIVMEGLHPERRRFRTRLPGARGVARVFGLSALGVSEGHPLTLTADTLHIEGDEQTFSIVFRRSFPLPPGATLAAVRIEAGVELPGESIPWSSDPPVLSTPAPSAPPSRAPASPPVGASTLHLSEDDFEEVAGDTMFLPPEPPPPAAPAVQPTMMLSPDRDPVSLFEGSPPPSRPVPAPPNPSARPSAPVAAPPLASTMALRPDAPLKPATPFEPRAPAPVGPSFEPRAPAPIGSSEVRREAESSPSSADLPPAPPVVVEWLGSPDVAATAGATTFGGHFLAAMDRARRDPAEDLAPRPARTKAFSPFELSILEEHAEQAAFLWSLRDAAVSDPRYDTKGLRRLDDRVEAHLDALRLAGDTGWEMARAALDFPDAGVAFVAAALALDRLDRAGVARVLDTMHRSPACMDGVAGALGWVPFEHVARMLPGLLSPGGPPELHHLGIAGCAFHRRDPGPALVRAMGSTDARLRARALLAAGELGRVDLRALVREALTDQEVACRFAAGFTGVLLGEPEAVRALVGLAEAGGPFAARASAMAVRRMPVSAARAWLTTLADRAGSMRAALFGVAALGDVEMVPWLLERMSDPALARVAAGVFAAITGADFLADKLEGGAPEGFVAGPTDDPEDEDVSMDPDEVFPWPDAAAVKAWWDQKREGLPGGRRYLMGRPLEPAWLEELQRSGHQHVRAAAAVELCLAGRRRVLLEVRGPARGVAG